MTEAIDELPGDDFEQVRVIDAPRLVQQVSEAGGPRLELRQQLAGGAVGAWLVQWQDGHTSVLTWAPAIQEGQQNDAFGRAVAMMDLAQASGVPLPAYEAIVPLPDGAIAVVQEQIIGATPKHVTVELVDQLIDVTECLRHVVTETEYAGTSMPLHLRSDGPGFCLHGPLRNFNSTTSALLDKIEASVDKDDDQLEAIDVVHFDFHVGNVLVDPQTPGRIAAVVDWGGAAPGRVELDLAILAFDLTRRAPGRVQQRVEQHLLKNADEQTIRKVWAHASLRLLDWTIRHHPKDIDHWVTVANRYLAD